MKRLILIAALLCAACATSAPYAPATRAGGTGYSETRIENDRYRVNFKGAATPEQASDYVLLRAAELTLQSGYAWFVVDQRFTDARTAPSRPRVSIGIGAGSYGGGTSVGVGVGTGVGVGSGGGGDTSASLEFRMGTGARPETTNAYDARDVASSIGARVRRP